MGMCFNCILKNLQIKSFFIDKTTQVFSNQNHIYRYFKVHYTSFGT